MSRFVASIAFMLALAGGSVHAQSSREEFNRAVGFGKRFFEIREYTSAYENFAKANSLYPDQPGILYNMALILSKLQRYNEAQSLIDRFKQLYPAGQELSLVSDLSVELDFQRVLEQKRQENHDYVELFNRGKFNLEKGSYREALDLFAKAEEQRPNDSAIPYNQAVIHEQLGDFVKATERLRRYLDLNQGASDKPAIDQKIFALETEIDDMRHKIVCTFCGEKLPVGSTWCHRCWSGPFLTSSGRWNSRVCGVGATATRSSFYSDGRLSKNEELSCVLKEKNNFLQSVLYTPVKRQAIQEARKGEGWSYSNGILQAKNAAQGDQIRLDQKEYLERVLALTTGEVLTYEAHKSPNGIWLLDREDYVVSGQRYMKRYTFDSAGRILQEKVSYQSAGCNHLITMTADYVYENSDVTSVKLRSSYDGYTDEGSPQTTWDGIVSFIYDAQGRVEREEFTLTSHQKTFAAKPNGPLRDDFNKAYPGMRVKKPVDIIKRGDVCRLEGTTVVGNQIDLRPFYTISPNLALLLPHGVSKLTVSMTYPEAFSITSK